MNRTAKKMSKIIDELMMLFISAGSDGIHMDIQKQENGYELTLKSGYDPAERKKIDDLERFFSEPRRNDGLEEFFWQLAGVTGSDSDSELHLIAQMVELKKLEITDDAVEIVVYKGKNE